MKAVNRWIGEGEKATLVGAPDADILAAANIYIFTYMYLYIHTNKNHRTLNILEFKQSSDRNKDFLRVKEDEANEQHRSIIEALRTAAPE